MALVLLVFASPLRAETEKRIAFVVGNAAYQAAPLATTANDAGLVAQTLQAAGFDVTGARDLDGESLRSSFRDFLEKAQASGPDTVVFVYLAGYGLQLDGENYFAPVDAKILSASDVAVEALRISDYAKRLAGLPLKASFIVLDAARDQPFVTSGPPLAGGLALTVAEPNTLVAFNAAPGTVAPTEQGPYGAYARALTEMIRDGGLPPSDLFEAVRLRVNEETKGAQVPWDASRIAAPFLFFERAANAPPPALAADRITAIRSRPLRDLGAQDAYAAVIERDTMQGYEDFLTAYPTDPLAYRVRAILAARREATTWLRTCRVGTPDAYWSYLNRYPNGPHAADARWRLDALAAAPQPPPSFVPMIYDVPPPPPAEIVYVDRPVLVFNDPVFGFVPPPPIVVLAPPPAYLVFPPPPPPVGLFVLPTPAFVPVPAWNQPTRLCRAAARERYFHQYSQHDHHQHDQRRQSGGVGGARCCGRRGRGCSGRGGGRDRRESRPAALRGPQGVPHGRPGRSRGSIPAGRGREPLPATAGAGLGTRPPAGHELPGVSPGKPLPPGRAKEAGDARWPARRSATFHAHCQRARHCLAPMVSLGQRVMSCLAPLASLCRRRAKRSRERPLASSAPCRRPATCQRAHCRARTASPCQGPPQEPSGTAPQSLRLMVCPVARGFPQ